MKRLLRRWLGITELEEKVELLYVKRREANLVALKDTEGGSTIFVNPDSFELVPTITKGYERL